jgi:hypothetical protein
MRKINTEWFFRETPFFLKLVFIYVNGDAIILLPFLFIDLILAFFTWKLALILFLIYAAIRNLGEMIYWLFQQFGERKYRPQDFGLNNLDNHAIYILYQTFSLAICTLSIFLLFLLLLKL